MLFTSNFLKVSSAGLNSFALAGTYHGGQGPEGQEPSKATIKSFTEHIF